MKYEKIRELTDICEQEENGKQTFEMVIHDIPYCKLSGYRQGPIDCKYLSDMPDHNDLYICNKRESFKAQKELESLTDYLIN